MKKLIIATLLLYGCNEATPVAQQQAVPAQASDKPQGIEQTILLTVKDEKVAVKGIVQGTPGNYTIFLPGDEDLNLNDKWLYERKGKVWMEDIYSINGVKGKRTIDNPDLLYIRCVDGKLYFSEQIPESCYDEREK